MNDRANEKDAAALTRVRRPPVSTHIPAVQRQPAEELGPRAQQTIITIVDATRRVFLTRGYLGTTVDEIARLAGVSRGTVYTYFATKRELLLAVGEEASSSTIAVIERLAALGPTRAGMRTWTDECFAMLEVYGSFAFAWTQAATEDDEIYTAGRRGHLHLAKLFGEALTATVGRDAADPTALGVVLFSMLERAWAYCQLYGSGLDAERVKAELATALWGAAREARAA